MIFNNASKPLTLPTHEGSGQATHPSVMDFKVEHGISSWGGYRYWMAMTPYPFTNDAHEDPNLIASNDNVNWVVPSGIVNPLDDALGGMANGFHNDPDMVYNPDTNELWLYYRFSSSAKQETKLIKISEDMSVTEPQVVMLLQPFTQNTNVTRSFCVWRESSTKWHMWGSGGARPYKNYYFSSPNGIEWSSPTQVLNREGVDPFHAIGYEVWHMSCKPNFKKNRIEFMTYCWTLGGGQSRTAKIIHTIALTSEPTIMTTPVVVLGVGSGWDGSHLYRPSFVIEEDKYHLWYSAIGGGKWGIGYTSYEPYTAPPDVPRDTGVYWHKIKSLSAEGKNIDEIKVNLGYWHGVKEVFVKR